MPDILTVTTPVINQSQAVIPKPGMDPLNPFVITDPTRVVRTHNQSDLLRNNTGMDGRQNDSPVLLMNLLKDPAVAVTYLKNIFMLEETFKLLPQNNKTVTTEIEQLCQAIVVSSEHIKEELVKQEHGATGFRGELFDFLRNVSNNFREKPAVLRAVANLLKSINNISSKGDILDSVSNSLNFLKSELESNPKLAPRLETLIAKFQSDDAVRIFPELKLETLSLVKDIESSLLYSPKFAKVLSIIVYNLSRYNDSMFYFNESSFRLRQMLPPESQKVYIDLINQFSAMLKNGTFPIKRNLDDNSNVMDALVKMVYSQSVSEEINLTDSSKVDNILTSLLSSPCNFTPLLHFVIPLVQNDVKAFAEIWINPNSDEKDMPEGVKEGKHFLLVIDVENVGRFEAEFFSHDNIIDFFLYCPSGYETHFEDMMRDLPSLIAKTDYKIGQTKLETLDTARSLMQVFKSLPYKRVGVDVKV